MENNINETITNNEQQQVEQDVDYIQMINELKQNSVDVEMYNKVVNDNKRLANALINNQQLPKEEDPMDKLEPRLEYYKKYKENKFNNDLEYWDNFLKLRKATIKEYGGDPCITGEYGMTPDGGKLEPAYGERETINEQLDTIEKFIEQSKGDPKKFETLMQTNIK